MTADVSAGRLYAEVVADTTGFARDAKAKVDAEVRSIKARIKAEIDTRGFATQVKAAAKEASAGAVVRLKVELDTKGLITQARAAAKEASKAAVVRLKVELDAKGVVGQAKAVAAAASAAATVKLKTDIDGSQAVAQAKAAAEAASRGAAVQLKVEVDTAKAAAEIDALKEKAKRPDPAVPNSPRDESKGLGAASKMLKDLSTVPAITGGIYMLGTAIVQLGGGLISVASAASQAVGVLGAIPNLVGAAAQGIGALVIGFSGVGTALGAMGKAEQATTAATVVGGAEARATARAVEAASVARSRAARSVGDAQRALGDAQRAADTQSIMGAREVADARLGLANARQQATDAERASIKNVADSEWALARAQESAKNAQVSLTKARQDARQRIDDLNFALKQGALDEKGALLAVEAARLRLQDAKWNPATTDLGMKEAELAYQQAKTSVEGIRKANSVTARDAAKANKDGVEGAVSVKQARADVRDTLHTEMEATQALAKAQYDAAKSQIASARSIALAQRSLGDALKSQQQGAIAAARGVEMAQRGIADAKYGLAQADRNLADANRTAAAGSAAALTALAAQEAALKKLTPAGREFVKFLYGLKARWVDLRNTTQAALLPPIQAGIQAALPLIGTLQTGLAATASIVGGLGQSLGQALGEKTFNKDVGTVMASNNRALTSFGAAGLNVVQILRDMAVAAGPLTERFAKWTAALTGTWSESIKAARETGKLEQFFKKAGDTAALLGDILGNVTGALFSMGKASAPAGQDLLKTFDQITQKWQTLAASPEGQKRMKEFFDATKPVTDELGRLVVNLVEFITKAGEGGGGSLAGFLKTLNLLLDGINKFMSIPGAAPILGAILTLAGVGGALGLVASMVLKIGKNLEKVGKFTGFSKLIAGIRGSKEAIDDELPKDKAKGEALDGLDGKAKKTGDSLGGKFTKGVKAASAAVVSGAKALGSWVVAMARAGAATAATTVKLVAQRVAAVAVAVASGIARAASIAWTAIQWLLNVALSANPIGLIVIGIGLLVGAFIWAMTHSEKFRSVVFAALNGIKNVAITAFNAVKGAVTTVVRFIGDHWKLIVGIIGGPFVAIVLLVTTYWSQIKSAISGAVGFVIGFVRDHWKLLLGIIGGPFIAIVLLITSHWNLIKSIFGGAVGYIVHFLGTVWKNVNALLSLPMFLALAGIRLVFNLVRAAFTAARDWVIGIFKKSWDKISGVLSGPISAAKTFIGARIADIRAGFVAIRDWVLGTFSAAWAKIRDKLTGPINDAKAALSRALGAGKDGLQATFTNAVSAITRIWDGLKNAAKAPIKFIVNTVLNDGLIGGFNWLADKVGAPKMDPITLPKGFEDGGQYTGRIPGRPSKKDNLVARGPLGQRIGLATGEFIVNAVDTAKNLPLLKAINAGRVRMSNAVQAGFADGGLIGKLKAGIGGAVSAGKSIGSDVLGFLGDPLKWFKDRMHGPLDRLKELGTSQFAETVKAVPRKIVDVVGSKAKDLLQGLGGGGQGGGGGGAVVTPVGSSGGSGVERWRGVALQALQAAGAPVTWIGSLMRRMNQESGGNPRAINNWDSNAAAGHPSQGLMQTIPGTFSAYAGQYRNRGITDPFANIYAAIKYTISRYGSGPAGWDRSGGYAEGGLVGGDALMRAMGVTFDTGGWLNTGRTVVDNGTGEHEAILKPEAWQGASSVLDQIARIAGQVRTTQGTASAAAPAPMIGSLALTVGTKADLPDALDEVNHRLRVIDRGGVYARHTP